MLLLFMVFTAEEDEMLVRNTRDEFVRREGLAEGEAKGKTEIATNLLKENYPIEKIIKVTGLSKAEIEKLK